MAQLKATGITGSLEVINAYITGSITGSDAKFTSITGSLQGNATSATNAATATESQFIVLPTSIEFDETSYDEDSNVNDVNWISLPDDVIRIADTGTYVDQKFLVLREPFVGLRLKRMIYGTASVSSFVMRNSAATIYDSTGLNLSQSINGDNLVLQYSLNGTSWIDYTNVMTGSSGSGLEITSSVISVTGISSPYFLRFAQTSSRTPEIYSTHYTESWESGYGDWTNGSSAFGETESDDITDLIGFTRGSSTPSNGTGPTSAHDGSIFIFAETSSPNLDSDWFGIQRSFTAAQSKDFSFLSFYYHMYGATIGTLWVKVSADNGASWTSLNITKDADGTPSTSTSISGQQQISQTDPYLRAIVDLGQYSGTDFLVRFVYQGGNSFTGDIGIDKVEFFQAYPQYAIKDVTVSYEKGTLQVDGVISASTYVGDGSSLTGIVATNAVSASFATTSATTNYVNWSNVDSTPTTVSGYGITDAVTLTANNTFTGANSFSNPVTIQSISFGKGVSSNSYFQNIGIGTNALASANSSQGSVAIGYSSMTSATTANYTTAIGTYTLANLSSAQFNTAIGYYAGYTETGGGQNTLVGAYSGYNLSNSSTNTSVGYRSMYGVSGVSTSAISNTAVGYASLENITTGDNNVAIGYESSKYLSTATQNVTIGRDSGRGITTGGSNVAIGYRTMASYDPDLGDATGYYNVGIGYYAGQAISSGYYNVAIGYNAGRRISNSRNNIAIGNSALTFNQNEWNNTAIGYEAGYNTTGSTNTFIGYRAGYSVTTGDYNTIIGWYQGSATMSNHVVLADGQNNVRLFIDNNGNARIGTGTTAPSAKLEVDGSFRSDIYIDGTTVTASTYTVSSNDFGKTILFNSTSTQTITFPSGLGAGFNLTMVQVGTGTLSIATSGGPTLVNRNSHNSSSGQYASISVIVLDASTYLLIGDTA